jgi:hypothetical protein
MLRTTINMRFDIFHKISLAASMLGKSRRQVVIKLLIRLMSDMERLQGGFMLVRYQERDPIKHWHCFSISFRRDENEFFTDLRKLGKFSVSRLVAIATELYLDELLREGGSMHNYARFEHYSIGRRTEGGIICWEMYWGDPTDTMKGAGATLLRRTRADFTIPA